MRAIGNILWLLLGGLELAVAYVAAGILAFVFIVTIPFGLQAFKLAGYVAWPFGRVVVDNPRQDFSGTTLTLANLIWFLIAGWWLVLAHVVFAVALAVTVIGIPFAVANLKFAGLALEPFGRTVVPASPPPDRVVLSIEPLDLKKTKG